MDNRKRVDEWDMLKGILIIAVVLGHYGVGILHDVIFWFHMPLFFMVSGMFCKVSNQLNSQYISNKILR